MNDRLRWWSWRLMAAATSCVIAISAARGIRNGYQAVGDNGLTEIRARDVLTSNHPLLSLYSSASTTYGIELNHPGPLLFEIVALPVRLFGGAAGIAVGIAVLNIAIVWAVGFVTVRHGGATAALIAQVCTAGLVFMLGSELLYDPWAANVLILPFWLLVLLVWAVAADDIVLLPFAVGLASFVMQTHVVYLFFVPALVVAAIAIVVLRRRGRGTDRFSDLWAPLRNSLIVAVVLWAQPLWEQFFGEGSGNLGRLASAAAGRTGDRSEESRMGLALATRLFSAVVSQPPWWGRGGFDDSVPHSRWVETSTGFRLDTSGLAGPGVALAWLAATISIVALGWWVARRHQARSIVAGYWVLATCSAMAIVTIMVTPLDLLGISADRVRYLWVIGAFATYLLVMTALTVLRPSHRHAALAGLAGLGAIAALATIPFHAHEAGPVMFRATYPGVEDLRDQLHNASDEDPGLAGRVRFDIEGIGFAEPYTAPLMAQLLADGVDMVADASVLGRQLGSSRLATPDDAETPVIFVRVGAEALQQYAGARRIAFHDGALSPYSVTDIEDLAVGVFISDDGRVPVADR